MSEAILTQSHIEDGLSVLENATDRVFVDAVQKKEHFDPTQIEVPRPDFGQFLHGVAQASQEGTVLERVNDRLRLQPGHHNLLASSPGLMGLVTIKIGGRSLEGPAIILADGRSAAMLAAEQIKTAPTGQAGKHRKILTPMQQALLDIEYAKAQALVTDTHKAEDASNAGAIGPALVVVSSTGNAHHELHGLAPSTQDPRSFGTKFSAAGRQDFRVGSLERKVISGVLQPGTFIFDTAPFDQVEFNPLGAGLSADQLAVGAVMGAALSYNPQHAGQVGNNLHNMVVA